jgi:hypothetical protein
MSATAAIATHAIAMPGMDFVPGVMPVVLTQPGLEFTLRDHLLHFALPLRALHFTLVDDDA